MKSKMSDHGWKYLHSLLKLAAAGLLHERGLNGYVSMAWIS